jgi:hypothetical protein
VSSLPQIEANRRNAQNSTGPKTVEGKVASAKNARKHGLLSREVLLPDEAAEEFSEFVQKLETALDPQGDLESVLVKRIIGLTWRLQRLERIEAGIMISQYYAVLADRAKAEAKECVRTESEKFLEDLNRNVTADPARHQAAIRAQRAAEDARATDTATLGQAFIRDSKKDNAFSKLSRYETSIERSLYKALHELQRLQAARRGQHVFPPVAIDIEGH